MDLSTQNEAHTTILFFLQKLFPVSLYITKQGGITIKKSLMIECKSTWNRTPKKMLDELESTRWNPTEYNISKAKSRTTKVYGRRFTLIHAHQHQHNCLMNRGFERWEWNWEWQMMNVVTKHTLNSGFASQKFVYYGS